MHLQISLAMISTVQVKLFCRIFGYLIFLIPLFWNLATTIKEYRQFRVIEVTEYEKVPYKPPDVILCFDSLDFEDNLLNIFYNFFGKESNAFIFTNVTSKQPVSIINFRIPLPQATNQPYGILSNWVSLSDHLRTAVLSCKFEGHNCSLLGQEGPHVMMEDNFSCIGLRGPFRSEASSRSCISDRSGVLELTLNRSILKKYNTERSRFFFLNRRSYPWVKNQLAQVKIPNVELKQLTKVREAKIQLTLRLGTRLNVHGQRNRCGDPEKRGENVQQFFPRRTRRYPYNSDLCTLLERQMDYVRLCGCLNLRLPVPAVIANDANLSCHRLPHDLHRTTHLVIDRNVRYVAFIRQPAKEILANFSFDDPVLLDLRCAARVRVSQQKHRSYFVTECPPSCQIEEYGRAPSIDLEQGSGDILHLSISPVSLDVPVVKEVLLFPPQTLMSNIGGMLGFWVGVSLISFVDFVRWTLLKVLTFWRFRKKVQSEV